MTLETFFRKLRKTVRESGKKFKLQGGVGSGCIRARSRGDRYCPIEFLATPPGQSKVYYYSGSKLLGLKAKDRDAIVAAADWPDAKYRNRLLSAVGLPPEKKKKK